jgi:hypothetical protein
MEAPRAIDANRVARLPQVPKRVAELPHLSRILVRLLIGYEAGLISRGLLHRLWRAALLEYGHVT